MTPCCRANDQIKHLGEFEPLAPGRDGHGCVREQARQRIELKKDRRAVGVQAEIDAAEIVTGHDPEDSLARRQHCLALGGRQLRRAYGLEGELVAVVVLFALVIEDVVFFLVGKFVLDDLEQLSGPGL